jgi:hypothetical protein
MPLEPLKSKTGRTLISKEAAIISEDLMRVNTRISPRTQNAIAAILLLIFLVIGSLSALGKTRTIDEAKHFRYGMNLLNGLSDRFDDSKMPVSALNALPYKVGTYLPEGFVKRVFSELFTARMVTLVLSALVAWLVFYWSRSLYGTVPGIVSLILYIFDPNIIAHSQLVTTDMYAWGTIALAFFCLWQFAHRRTVASGVLCALALGLSLLAKYTSVILLPLFLVTLILHDYPVLSKAWRTDGWKVIKTLGTKYTLYALVAIVIALLIINAGFLFNKTFTPFGDFSFRSQMFRSLQANLPWLGGVPVPLPYPYLEGLDWVIQREQSGEGYGSIYLLGQVRDGQGFDGYYFVAYLLKVPLASQIIVLVALVMFLKNRDWKRLLSDEVFLFVPVLFFAIYFNFFYNAQIGIRFYLVIFPFLYVFAGSLFTNWHESPTWQKASVYVLGAYLVISVLSYFPHYIPYFNELVWNRNQAYKYLADSNLDWSQNKNKLDDYLAEHPDVIFPRIYPTSGYFIVSVNRLVGVTRDPTELAWLRKNFEPVGNVAYSYLLYEISPQQIETLCRTTDYCE